jgi:hypothetical protein
MASGSAIVACCPTRIFPSQPLLSLMVAGAVVGRRVGGRSLEPD